MIELLSLTEVHADAVEQLLDRAFGADRHARTAYRLRAGVDAIPGLSLAAVENGALIGSIQCWPVRHVGANRAATPLVLVGPVAVDPARQRDGVGRQLMTAALLAAAEAGLDRAMMLIGDPDYYGRFFGFDAAATARWELPGPVERHRLLARGPAVPTGAGSIGPRVRVAA